MCKAFLSHNERCIVDLNKKERKMYDRKTKKYSPKQALGKVPRGTTCYGASLLHHMAGRSCNIFGSTFTLVLPDNYTSHVTLVSIYSYCLIQRNVTMGNNALITAFERISLSSHKTVKF